jgi:hypothetical protein
MLAGEDVPERLREAPATPGPGVRKGFTRKGSRHGLTHGLHSQEAVIDGEDPAAFEAYREDLLTEMQPVGIREGDLVETMVMAQWKLRRLWRGETEVCGRSQAAQIFNDFHGPRQYAALTSHEAHLMRAYLRAEARLRLLQDLRRKALGMAVDVAKDAGHAAGARAVGLPEAPATPCSAPLPIHADAKDPTHSADGVGAHRDAPAGEPEPPPPPTASAVTVTSCSAETIGEITNRLPMTEARRAGNAGDADLPPPEAPDGWGAAGRAGATPGPSVSFGPVAADVSPAQRRTLVGGASSPGRTLAGGAGNSAQRAAGTTAPPMATR